MDRKQLEEIIIGQCVLDNGAYYVAADYLTEKSFRYPLPLAAWKVCTQLQVQDMAIDLVTVSVRLQPQLKKQSAAYQLARMMDKVNSSCNLAYHSMLLLELNARDYCSELLYSEAQSHGLKSSIGKSLLEVSETFQDPKEDVLEVLEVAIGFSRQLIEGTTQKLIKVDQVLTAKADRLRQKEGLKMLLRQVDGYAQINPEYTEIIQQSITI